jgi:DNA-binding NarL/FixJ family response regulator
VDRHGGHEQARQQEAAQVEHQGWGDGGADAQHRGGATAHGGDRGDDAEPTREHRGGRDADVLALMAEGLTNTGIASRLCVSERTVEAHARRVLMKLDILEEAGHRRVLAVLAHLRATREDGDPGWISP